ncbi:hypothetical protein GCM10010170_041590 [Dactylosporangium salmoneum]|uniref:Uncharacterized protein n=1 Tax=Dactylosporangium salmoneum TaxID=53361 RepID=A0ABP5TFH3_9ACTN
MPMQLFVGPYALSGMNRTVNRDIASPNVLVEARFNKVVARQSICGHYGGVQPVDVVPRIGAA